MTDKTIEQQLDELENRLDEQEERLSRLETDLSEELTSIQKMTDSIDKNLSIQLAVLAEEHPELVELVRNRLEGDDE